MSGVELKTIADYQLAIRQLDRNNPEDRKKIEEYCLRIGELMKSQTEPIKSGNVEIKSEMGAKFSVDPKIAQDPEVQSMQKYLDEAYIEQTFGDAEMTEAKFEQIKKDYEAAEKALKEAREANKDVKYSKYGDKSQFASDKANKFKAVEEAQKRYQEAKAAYDKAKIVHDVNKGDVNKGIKKAAKRNVENYTNVLNTQRVFLSKAEEEAAIAKDPSLDGKTSVLKDKNIDAIMAIGAYAQYKIDEAEKTGDPAAIDAAKEKYGLYTDMFNRKEDGSIDFSAEAINVRNAQNALVDESGFDQRFNLDEVETMSKMYGVSKSDIKSTVKKFGFGAENGAGQRWKAAGLAAGAALAGNVLNHLLGNTSKTATAHAEHTETAVGETITGDINWMASNGEEFYHYYEASGGTAVATAVADAIAEAKLPLAGSLLAPALAGITAFLLTKPETEDAFNGANVEAVLQDINLVEGKDNKAIVNKIQGLEITGVKSTDDAIKAAVLKAALGENTKKANTEELLAAFEQLNTAKEVIGQIKVEPKKEPEKKDPVKEEPVTPTPEPEPEPIERIPEKRVDHEFNVNHRYGMGPWQYGEAIGIPAKYMREFINEFRKDNNLDSGGVKYNKTPKFNDKYTFKDGTVFDTPDKEETQRLIDAYDLGAQKAAVDGKGKAIKHKAVTGNPIAFDVKSRQWVYVATKEPVPKDVLENHPTYKKYVADNGHD